MNLVALFLALGLVRGAHPSSSPGISGPREDAHNMESLPRQLFTREEYFASKDRFRHNREAPRVFSQANKEFKSRGSRKRTRTDRDDRKMQAAYLAKKTRLNPEILKEEEEPFDPTERGQEDLLAASSESEKEKDFDASEIRDVPVQASEIQNVPIQSAAERKASLALVTMQTNLTGSFINAIDEFIASIEKVKVKYHHPHLSATVSGICQAALKLVQEGIDLERLSSMVTRINQLTDELELEVLAAELGVTRLD